MVYDEGTQQHFSTTYKETANPTAKEKNKLSHTHLHPSKTEPSTQPITSSSPPKYTKHKFHSSPRKHNRPNVHDNRIIRVILIKKPINSYIIL